MCTVSVFVKVLVPALTIGYPSPAATLNLKKGVTDEYVHDEQPQHVHAPPNAVQYHAQVHHHGYQDHAHQPPHGDQNHAHMPYPGYHHVKYGESGSYRRTSQGESADFSKVENDKPDDRDSRGLGQGVLDTLMSNNIFRTDSSTAPSETSTPRTTTPTVVDDGMQKYVHMGNEDGSDSTEQVSIKLGPITKQLTTVTGDGVTQNVVSGSLGDLAKSYSIATDGNSTTEVYASRLVDKINRLSVTQDGEITSVENKFEFNEGGDYIAVSVDKGDNYTGSKSTLSVNENTLSLTGEAGTDQSGQEYLKYQFGAISEGTRATVNSTHTLTFSAKDGIDLDHDVTIVKNLDEVFNKLSGRHLTNGIPGLVGKIRRHKKIEKLKYILRNINPNLVPPTEEAEDPVAVAALEEAIPGIIVARSVSSPLLETVQIIFRNIGRSVMELMSSLILELKSIYLSYTTCTTVECVFDLYMQEYKR